MFTPTQMLIINMVLTLVNTGILIGICVDKKEFRSELHKVHKRIISEFDRIYDAECDNQYELEHLKEKEKSK